MDSEDVLLSLGLRHLDLECTSAFDPNVASEVSAKLILEAKIVCRANLYLKSLFCHFCQYMHVWYMSSLMC